MHERAEVGSGVELSVKAYILVCKFNAELDVVVISFIIKLFVDRSGFAFQSTKNESFFFA